MLEKMRHQVKGKKKGKLAEYCFVVPVFAAAAQLDPSGAPLDPTPKSQLQEYYEEQVKENELSYNHFVSM